MEDKHKVSLRQLTECPNSHPSPRLQTPSHVEVNEKGEVWAIRLELAIAKKEYNINFEACLAFSTGAQDVAQLLSMNVFEIADPGNIGRKMRSIWLSVARLKEICRELAQVDGQPPEEIYTVFRSVYNKGRLH